MLARENEAQVVQEPELVCTESDYSSEGSSVTAEASPIKISKCRSEIDTFAAHADESSD